MRRKRLVRIIMIAPFAIAFMALFGFVVMWLWNWLMPDLFGLRSIGYWQAWGLIVLGKILVGGFHGGGGAGRWRHRMMERCEQMTPEEREKFREAFLRRWGRETPPETGPSGA